MISPLIHLGIKRNSSAAIIFFKKLWFKLHKCELRPKKERNASCLVRHVTIS